MPFLEVVTIFLVAVAMSLALAHALEFPGKMRLTRDNYLATQSIYYPGFTLGGLGEGLGMVATFVLFLAMPRGTSQFWWALAGLIAIVIMHGIFWIVTQPVNRYWVGGLPLTDAAEKFFLIHRKTPVGGPQQTWQQMRDTWEYSHITRAVFAVISLISVSIAIALNGGS